MVGTLKVINPNGKEDQYHITLESIVVFATGMPKEPPLGFSPKSALLFEKDAIFPLPTHMQINCIFLYRKWHLMDSNTTYHIARFLNSAGFGQP